MNVTGVIAEYNPFHNGHAYQLKELRERTQADYMIVAMSGDFLQRGVPALLDKHTRAKMALLCGADLVLEIPSVWATASAEYFATAGIFLLGATGVVSTIGYGAESDGGEFLSCLCRTLSDAPDSYNYELAALQKEGLSYPLARNAALCALLPQFSARDITEFLSQPNNILALEYEKAISAWNKTASLPLESHMLLRIGGGYHDTHAHSGFASATAIRKCLAEGGDAAAFLPPAAAALLEENKARLIFWDDISVLLYYRLLLCLKTGYEAFADCTPALSAKIANSIYSYESFTQFCELLKSRDLTYTRISRVLLHILLDIRKEDYSRADTLDMIPYLRVLGFRKQAASLLSSIKKEASAPLITKVADASWHLSSQDYEFLKKDIFAADLYRGLALASTNSFLKKTEFTQEIIML